MDRSNEQQNKNDYTSLFHIELFQSEHESKDGSVNSKAETVKLVLPEQLNTDKPLSSHVVLRHLQKVAEGFENYASKLLNAIKPQDKRDCDSDNSNNQKCPFMRVASAVGFKYAKADNE